VIGPLESGTGVTLGNALRRVLLLASLSGAAVTSIKVEGIHHESRRSRTRKRLDRVILNVKQLRFKLFDSDQSVRLHLEARGRGTVTAGDIQLPAQIEIINPDLHMLTLDSDDAAIDMDLR